MIAPSSRRAFSLIELLAVITIMTIAMVLTCGAFFNFARGVDVSNSAQHVTDVLNLARQIATSRGEYTQVRLLSPADTSDPRHGQFAGLAIFRADSPYYTNNYSSLLATNRMRQEGAPVYLPSSCAILSNSTYSPLVAILAADTNRSGTTSFGGVSYRWIGFYFKPDGSTDLPPFFPTNSATATTNAFSISSLQAFKATGKLPPNYAVLSLDRVDGRLTLVRP